MKKINEPGYNKATFDSVYGEGKWSEFARLVRGEVRPQTIWPRFTNQRLNKQMTRQTFYKWKERV